MEIKTVYGIAAFIFENFNKEIITIKENKNKPIIDKKKGMISFPLETSNPGENPNLTFQRLLSEELGINKNQVELQDTISINLKIESISGIIEIVTHLFIATYIGQKMSFTPRDNDVQFNDWMTIDELFDLPEDKRRKEVRLIIEIYNQLKN